MLTKVASRRYLDQQLENAISQSIREGKVFSVLFIDLNNFKPINDTLGHKVGDEVLKIVSKRLVQSIRPNDLCARFGGDEFVILVEPSKKYWDINIFIQKIELAISSPMSIQGRTLSVSASIGSAAFPVNGHKASDLLKYADTRMYEHKIRRAAKSAKGVAEDNLIAATYISHSLIADDKIEKACNAIRENASRENARRRISGVLYYCRNRFIQRLEGPKEAVTDLIDRIKLDKRHRSFSLLSYNHIPQRVFEDWSHMPVHFDANTFPLLDEFLSRLEVNAPSNLNEQEALYIVETIKQLALITEDL